MKQLNLCHLCLFLYFFFHSAFVYTKTHLISNSINNQRRCETVCVCFKLKQSIHLNWTINTHICVYSTLLQCCYFHRFLFVCFFFQQQINQKYRWTGYGGRSFDFHITDCNCIYYSNYSLRTALNELYACVIEIWTWIWFSDKINLWPFHFNKYW